MLNISTGIVAIMTAQIAEIFYYEGAHYVQRAFVCICISTLLELSIILRIYPQRSDHGYIN